MIVRRRFLPVTAFCLAMALALGAADARAQGYQGLFADDEATTKQAPSRNQQPPAGYQGLIPGAVPQAPAAAAPAPAKGGTQQQPAQTATMPLNLAPGATAQQPSIIGATPAPASAIGIKPIRNSDDLRELAMMYSVDQNLDSIPDEMAAQFRLPETTTEMLKQPRPRINGMLPMEMSVKNSVDSAMSTLRDPKLRPADRQARAKLALESLKTIQSGLKSKSQVSDRTYQLMGMPPIYIKEEREAATKAMQHVEAALRQLQAQ